MIQIRRASVADCDLILQFIRELAEYEKLLHRVSATPEKLRATLFGERAYAEAIIGEIDGVPRGFALYFHNYSTFLAKPGLYLEDLYVQPQARGAGLGMALIAACAKIAVQRDCGRLDWAVLDWNTPAIEFYRSLGAIPQDDWTGQRLEADALSKVAARSISTI
jgi:GNAT superfamily N-acetyltransferase